MLVLRQGGRSLGVVRIIRESPGGAGAISLAAPFVVFPGPYELVEGEKVRPITVTAVFPSLDPIRIEAQIEPQG